MKEIWKDIKGYEGLYQVSNLGNIKSLNYGRTKQEKILRPKKHTCGYSQICLHNNSISKYFYIHRLVAEAFIPNSENKPCIDHINTIKTDNRVENLRWVTSKENSNNILTKEHIGIGNKGKITSEETKEKLRKYNTIPIYCVELDKVFCSIRECARELHLDSSSIAKTCKGKHKTTKGYHFKYLKDIEEDSNEN